MSSPAPPLRILCLGAGAVGGYYCGRLSPHIRLTILVHSGRARQLRDNGLRIFSPWGNQTITEYETLVLGESKESDAEKNTTTECTTLVSGKELDAKRTKMEPEAQRAKMEPSELVFLNSDAQRPKMEPSDSLLGESEESDDAKRPKTESFDLVFVGCKAYDLEGAVKDLGPFVGENTVVLPVLNGLRHMQVLDEVFGVRRVAGGSAHIAATLNDDGHVVEITETQRITFGARAGNAEFVKKMLDRLDEAFRKTVVEINYTDMIEHEMWEKFVLLTSLASITCMMRSSIGDILKTDDGKTLILRMLQQCTNIADAAGYPPRAPARQQYLDYLTLENSPLTASMMRDLEKGHSTEARHVVMDMLIRGRALGVKDVDLLSTAWTILHAQEIRKEREARA